MKALDKTWWQRHPSGEFYTQQNDAARLVKLRTGRKVSGWILYIAGVYRGQWSTFALAKQRAFDLTTS